MIKQNFLKFLGVLLVATAIGCSGSDSTKPAGDSSNERNPAIIKTPPPPSDTKKTDTTKTDTTATQAPATN